MPRMLPSTHSRLVNVLEHLFEQSFSRRILSTHESMSDVPPVTASVFEHDPTCLEVTSKKSFSRSVPALRLGAPFNSIGDIRSVDRAAALLQ